jgi:hypothetical protein
MRVMTHLIRLIASIVSTLTAALLGNWLGDQLRCRITGEAGHQWRFAHTGSQGETQIAINPVLTNFIPALLLGLLLRPGWLWAFLGGAAISGLVGDRFEHPVTAKLAKSSPQ